MKTRRGAKRLTRLVISEVSAVDRGAGEGVRIALVKRAAKGERWAGNFDGAIGLDKAGNRKPAKKAKRIKSDMGKPISATTKATNPAPAPVIEEEHPMPKVSNAVAAMSERADEILKSDSSIRSRESAIAKVAVSADPRDRQIWDAYRADFDAPAQAEPAPIAKVSSAYTQLMAKASILAKKIGVSEAVAFSKIYTAPENWGLVQADKAFNYARMAGEPAAEVEPAAARQTARDILDAEIQTHIDKALDPKEFVFQNLMRALRSSYRNMSEQQLRTLARQMQEKAPPLDRLGSARGYGGSAA